MNLRYHSGKVLAKQRIYETFISPGYYIALTIGLLIGYFLVSGFLKSIDASGFNPSINPVYNLIVKSGTGAFGSIIIVKLFAEGPFLFALHASFAPVLIFLTINTITKFGFEKNTGALELISYGPADGTSSFTGFYVKDLVFTIVALAVNVMYFLILSAANNLVLGPGFFTSVLMLVFLSASVFAYAIFAAVITRNNGSGIAFFAGTLIFFVIVQMGAYTIINSYVRSLASVFSWIIKWISPIFYWITGYSSAGYSAGLFFVSLLCLTGLSAVLLYISHLVMKHRGVRN